MIDDIEQAALDALREPHKSIHVLTERERVREQIVDYIKGVRIGTKVDKNDVAFFIRYPISSEAMADQILAIDGLEIKANKIADEKLRQEIAELFAFDHAEEPPCVICLSRADQVLALCREAGFVQVVK